jgi:tRNA(Ile)-lysidine synthase TilS/MesJ
MTLSERPAPVSQDFFDQAMRSLQPFEQLPHLAIAVSGGADSMALAALVCVRNPRMRQL